MVHAHLSGVCSLVWELCHSAMRPCRFQGCPWQEQPAGRTILPVPDSRHQGRRLSGRLLQGWVAEDEYAAKRVKKNAEQADVKARDKREVFADVEFDKKEEE